VSRKTDPAAASAAISASGGGGDEAHMTAALALARRGLGRTWPNPNVGCVIVKDGRVVGRGWTQPGGRPHAETEALARAGADAAGATAFSTLEPCSHHGQTPPCSLALIAARVARVVVAIEDPDPRVSGAGVRRMREAGVAVEVGMMAAEARALTAGFLARMQRGRPVFTWKAATTLDGRIATSTGESRWITGEVARARAHLLRATHDAVMVGIGTALADDPELTCRLPGLATHSPVRIVVDSQLRLPLGCKLVASARATPTWVVTLASADTGARAALAAAGVEVIAVDAADDGRPAMGAMAAELARRGLTRVLVEGGGRLIAALLAAGLIDQVVAVRAGSVIGGEGVPVVGQLKLAALADAPRFALAQVETCGGDVMETWRRA
jgi:diaminohydroxyphosphoribosylaminopyrimidine deaminase/5-amino-6-(5-phosphoribosylamino)uracil reductase